MFPLALYENRDFSNMNVTISGGGGNGSSRQGQTTYNVASAPFIGRDAYEDAYERVPIEDFGKSVLSKLGWQEGKAIGRPAENGKIAKVIQPIEYMPR